MPAPTTTDIERLLAPISADAPAGTWLRLEGTYARIREARREDDASIPQGVWERPLKIADYNGVVSLATEALATRTKDLQIAAWLADAWAHLHGALGAARGLELCAALWDRFESTMFPPVENGDDEERARVVEWLDDALARRLRVVRLGDERAPFTLEDWQRAGTEGNEPGLTREGILARMTMSGPARWAAVRDEVGAVLAATQVLEHAAARLRTPPTMRAVSGVLQTIQALIADARKATGDPSPAPPAIDPSPPGPLDPVAPARADGTPSTSGIASRAEAYRRLTEAADYLLRTEPHSPVPYLVKRAIGWGNMSLAELLHEFISGADDLVTTHRLLGMRSREE